MTQEEAQERFGLEGQDPGKLQAWNELSLEEKRQHRAHVRRFRTRLYQEHVYDGLSVLELAEKYKISRTYVISHIQKHTSMLAKKKELDIPAERLDQYNKLKALLDATYGRALKGDDFAIKSYVALAARFSKVIGLDAPTRFHHQVDKKTTVTHEHTVDIEDLERRIALVKERKLLLARSKHVANPISGHETNREDPVSEESYREDQNGVALSPRTGTEDPIDADFSVIVPPTIVGSKHILNPVPVPDYRPNVIPGQAASARIIQKGAEAHEILPPPYEIEPEDE